MGNNRVVNGGSATAAALSTTSDEIEGAAAYMLSSLSFGERKLADGLQKFERISKDGSSVGVASHISQLLKYVCL